MIFGQVPVGMSLTNATTGAGSQLSVALTRAGLGAGTSTSHWTANPAGQVIRGGSLSCTVTVNEQFAVPATFDAVHETVVVPTGNELGEVITVAPALHVTVGAGLPVTVGANASVRAHSPGVLFVVMFAGQVMAGVVIVVAELTVTLNVHVALLPAASVAVHTTGVVPTANAEPEGGAQLAGTPAQLSVAVGAAKLTAKVVWPDSASARMFAGQEIAGSCVSLTVTVNEHLLVLPAGSVATQFTAVTPLGKVEPDGGVQPKLTPGQLSVAVTVKGTFD